MPHLVLSSLFSANSLTPQTSSQVQQFAIGDLFDTPLFKIIVLGWPELKSVLSSAALDPLLAEQILT